MSEQGQGVGVAARRTLDPGTGCLQQSQYIKQCLTNLCHGKQTFSKEQRSLKQTEVAAPGKPVVSTPQNRSAHHLTLLQRPSPACTKATALRSLLHPVQTYSLSLPWCRR